MIYRTKTKYAPQNYLASRPDVYAVDSEVAKGVIYAVWKDCFFVLRSREAMFCPMEEVGVLISMCKDDEMKAEMKEISYDIINYDRGGRQYATFKSNSKRRDDLSIQ